MIQDTNERGCPICDFMDRSRASGACAHFRNAKREMLMGFKSLIEACIERMEEASPDGETGARKVNID